MALAPCLMLLAACAGPRWQKPGADAESGAADYRRMQRHGPGCGARDSNIDADILASRGRDWQDMRHARQPPHDHRRRKRGTRSDDVV